MSLKLFNIVSATPYLVLFCMASIKLTESYCKFALSPLDCDPNWNILDSPSSFADRIDEMKSVESLKDPAEYYFVRKEFIQPQQIRGPCTCHVGCFFPALQECAKCCVHQKNIESPTEILIVEQTKPQFEPSDIFLRRIQRNSGPRFRTDFNHNDGFLKKSYNMFRLWFK